MQTFQPGRTYRTRCIGDADMWVTIKVLSRTAKTIRIKDCRGERTLRVGAMYDGRAECVKPWGSYSMCPIITAEDR
jgi:hypothetical protein